MDELKIIGREEAIFSPDIAAFSDELCQTIKNSRFLVIGGAGSIGQSVTKEIFKRDPSALHIARYFREQHGGISPRYKEHTRLRKRRI